MPTLSSLALPPPRNWQDFEDLCCDLWRRLWSDPGAQKNGRSGQPQAGVDVFGRPDDDSDYAGLQCKLKGEASGLSRAEIEKEIEKAGTFKPPLRQFLIATTAPSDVAVQEAAREITVAQLQKGSFPVSIVSWDDILLHLASYPDLVAKHYPDFVRLRSASPPGGVTAIPSPPPHYLPRPEVLAALKARLLAADTARLGITSPRKAVGVQGMGGIGKSVLAAALSQDEEVKASFPDGIFWVAVGQQPDLIRFQVELTVAAGEARPVLESPHQGKLLLSRAFAERAALLVLDDVWSLDHATALNVLGPRGRLLITTRDAELLVGLEAEEYRVEVLDPESALVLLADWAGQEVDELPPEAVRVARECGYLPLALAMIGAMVRLRPTAWSDALDRLKRADLTKIRRNFPDYPYPDLLRAIEVSVKALEPEERERYLELAVFSEDAAIPAATLETLWAAAGLDAADARDLAAKITARSLAQQDADGRLRLHDLQADYLRHEAGDLRSLHSRLVDAYAARCPEGFALGSNDGYFFQNLPTHLLGAGRLAELHDLLLTYPWLEAKLGVTDINALLSDYDTLPDDPELHLLRDALRLSAHALLEAPEELPGQLHGRLLARTEEGIVALLARACPSHHHQWLRPLTPGLNQAGGALVRIFTGHLGEVNTVAVLPDGRVLSAASDETLRVWDVATGKTLQMLQGGLDEIGNVAVLPSGRVIFTSRDALWIWDVDSGETIQALDGHSRFADAITVSPDGRVVSASNGSVEVWDVDFGDSFKILHGYVHMLAALPDGGVVAGFSDGTMRILDINSAKVVQTLEGHSNAACAVAALPDGRVVSASQDGTLRVWDIVSGTTLQILRGHSFAVYAVAVLPDGRVVSASEDRTLRVWDVDSGKTLQILTGHSFAVLSVAVLPDGQIVSSCLDGTLRVWNVSSGNNRQDLIRHSDEVRAIAVLHNNRIVSASYDCTLRTWHATSGKNLQIFEGHSGPVHAVAVLHDGRIASTSDDETLKIWDDSGNELQTINTHPLVIDTLVILQNGYILSSCGNSFLWVWDIVSRKTLQILAGHSDRINAVTTLPADRAISASNDGTLRVWDTISGMTLQILTKHSGAVNAVAVLPNGCVVSASDDCTLRVWDITSGETVQILNGHSRLIQAVSILSADYIVSASYDRTLRVWNLTTGETVARLTLDASPTALAVLSDPGRFVVGDTLGHVYFLSLEGRPELVNKTRD